MLETIAIVLIVLWLLGLVSSYHGWVYSYSPDHRGNNGIAAGH